MKYFIDFEFIEGFHKPLLGKRRHFIDMISVGIYAEDDRSLHLISNEYRYKDANQWVKDNVLIPLYIQTVHGDSRNQCQADNFHHIFGHSNNFIRQEIADFLGCQREDGIWCAPEGIEVYGYYADYDWVLLCSLFGRMVDLPKGFPMYCIDLKQELDKKVRALSNSDFFHAFHIKDPLTFEEKLSLVKGKNTKYPAQNNEHNALDDARWNYQLYTFLNSF